MTMHYLICEKCGGYYELQEGESPDIFSTECDCGGTLKHYVFEAPKSSKISDFWELENAKHFLKIHEFSSALKYVEDKSENKKNISNYLFKISAVLAIIGVLILAAGIYNYENPVYGDNEKYSQNEINYFTEIGFASGERIRKWDSSIIRIKIIGSYTSDDLNSLNNAINDINHGARGFQMKLDSQNNSVEPNVEVYFIPRSQFNTYGVDLPESVGACEVWSDSTGRIQKARIVIPSDQIYQDDRSRIIPHELGHSLGLKDSYENKGSILYYRLQDRSKYSKIDKVMLRILYRDDILPGMSKNEVEAILDRSKSSFGFW